ncbi:MAG TPA: hypothetical protein VGI27_04725, partial [Solirubrobacteraceae bacterium]
GALVDSVRAGADRLATDLSAVEANMSELYDAAAGQTVTRAVAGESSARPSAPVPPAPAHPAPQLAGDAPAPPIPTPPSGAAAPQARHAQIEPPPLSPPEAAEPDVHVDPQAPENGDLDGARLIALNMALNGESREDADRYLAENFQLADRGRLIDEVYAAIES